MLRKRRWVDGNDVIVDEFEEAFTASKRSITVEILAKV
jgi:hypothetical protein